MVIFIVNINPKTGERKIIDPTGTELSEADKKILARALAKELIRHMKKDEENQRSDSMPSPLTVDDKSSISITEMIAVDKINLSQKLSLFKEYWSPKIVGELNDSYIKLAKLKGEFDWHRHDDEDELFFIVKGQLTIKFRDKDLVLDAGELVVIPKGVEHLPVAAEEVQVMLIEPKGTLNTGNVVTEKTKQVLEHI